MRVVTCQSKLSYLSHAVRLLGHRIRRGLTKSILRAHTRYRQKQGNRSPQTPLQPIATTVPLSTLQEPGLGLSDWLLYLKLKVKAAHSCQLLHRSMCRCHAAHAAKYRQEHEPYRLVHGPGIQPAYTGAAPGQARRAPALSRSATVSQSLGRCARSMVVHLEVEGSERRGWAQVMA